MTGLQTIFGKATPQASMRNRVAKRIRQTSGLLVTYAPPYAPNALIPDNGLALLAGVLRQAGHQVQVLDFCTTQTIRRLVPENYRETLGNIWHSVQARLAAGKSPGIKDIAHLLYVNWRLEKIQQGEIKVVTQQLQAVIREREVDWIGFKLWNGAGFLIPAAIAAELKRGNPGLQIFAGGSHVDYFMQNIFHTGKAFDVLIFGDGEEALLRHVARIGGSGEDIKRIPNSLFYIGKEIYQTNFYRATNLDELPHPAYDEESYPAMRDGKIKIVVIDESRGCDNFCKFCGHSKKSGGKIISKEPSRVVDEMVELWKRHGVTYFRFAGSSTPGSLLREIADTLLERGLKFRFTTFARAKDAVIEDYPVLRRAGHFGQFFGIESGSQEILNKMGKKLRVEEIEDVVEASIEAGYFTVLSFIGSPPGETDQTRAQTLGLIERTKPQAVIVNPPIVIPRTPWADWPEKFGFELKQDYLNQMMAYPVRYLLPLRLWPSFPYRLDGKSSKQIFSEVTQLGKRIDSLGILTGISDDMALMATAAGIEPGKFRDLTREYFFTGNADEIDGLVRKINRGIIDSKTS